MSARSSAKSARTSTPRELITPRRAFPSATRWKRAEGGSSSSATPKTTRPRKSSARGSPRENREAARMTTLSPPFDVPRFQRLLVVRLGAMGDIIHTLPAVAALRQAFPHAILGWLVEERWSELLCSLRYPRSGRRSPQRPLVERVHSVNTSEWRRAL